LNICHFDESVRQLPQRLPCQNQQNARARAHRFYEPDSILSHLLDTKPRQQTAVFAAHLLLFAFFSDLVSRINRSLIWVATQLSGGELRTAFLPSLPYAGRHCRPACILTFRSQSKVRRKCLMRGSRRAQLATNCGDGGCWSIDNLNVYHGRNERTAARGACQSSRRRDRSRWSRSDSGGKPRSAAEPDQQYVIFTPAGRFFISWVTASARLSIRGYNLLTL